MKKWINSFKIIYKTQIMYGKYYLDEHDTLHDTYYNKTLALLHDSTSIARLGKLRLESLPKPQHLTPVHVPSEILDLDQFVSVINTLYSGI
jgi:hypothetical protein